MTYKPGNAADAVAELARHLQVEFDRIAVELAAVDGALAALSDANADLFAAVTKLKNVAPIPPPPPQPSADVLWKWDATTVAPFGIHAKDQSRVTFTQAGGRNAVRLLTMPGDTNVNGSGDAVRCDLRLGNVESDAKEGREWWFKHSVWFPTDYVDLPPSVNGGMWHWGVILNWHDDSDIPGTQQPFQLKAMPRTAPFKDWPVGLNAEIYAGVGGVKQGEFPVGPIERNKWYDFKYHVRWNATNGFFDAWVNGQQFMWYKGPTLHAGHGAYLKVANYSTQTKASAVLHGAIVRARTEAALG